jgi:hypothetical protein
MGPNNRPPPLNLKDSNFDFAASRGFNRAPISSLLTEDSVISELEGFNDVLFRQIFLEISTIDGQGSLADQRHATSQHAKDLPKDSKHLTWSQKQKEDYRKYKEVSEKVKPARIAYYLSKKAWDDMIKTIDATNQIDQEKLTEMRLIQLSKADHWFQVSME